MQATRLKAARLRALDAYREPVRLFGLVTVAAGTAQTIRYSVVQRALLLLPVVALLAALGVPVDARVRTWASSTRSSSPRSCRPTPTSTRTSARGSSSRRADRSPPRSSRSRSRGRRACDPKTPHDALARPSRRRSSASSARRLRLGAHAGLPAAAPHRRRAPLSVDAADPEGALRGAHPRLGRHDARAAPRRARDVPGAAQAAARRSSTSCASAGCRAPARGNAPAHRQTPQ